MKSLLPNLFEKNNGIRDDLFLSSAPTNFMPTPHLPFQPIKEEINSTINTNGMLLLQGSDIVGESMLLSNPHSLSSNLPVAILPNPSIALVDILSQSEEHWLKLFHLQLNNLLTNQSLLMFDEDQLLSIIRNTLSKLFIIFTQ